MTVGGDHMVVVDGVRVRRDEAGTLGITVPSVPAPAATPETVDDGETTKKKPVRGKARTPANKQRTSAPNK